jgi:type IV secretory pathway TraG/TraD family ATPase VirD4
MGRKKRGAKCKHFIVFSYYIYIHIQMRHIYVLKLLIMLEISLINVIYNRIGKIWYITQSELNSCK